MQGDYIKAEGKAKRMGAQHMAIVAEGNNERLYFSPNDEQAHVGDHIGPDWRPDGELFGKSADQLPLYGYTHFHELFTNRQLTALTTFSDLVSEVQKQIITDGGNKGAPKNKTAKNKYPSLET